MDKKPIIVITGASKGIGRGMAEYYLTKGFLVAGCSRGESTLNSEDYMHSQIDVGNEREVRKWIRSIKKVYKRIDALVCMAAYAPANLLLTMTSAAHLEPVLKTNIAGTYYVCGEVAKIMMQQRSGRIITVSSMAVGLHEVGTSAYACSKSAIVEMTKILAKELAPVGVTCNIIAPSIYQSEGVDALGDEVIERAREKLTFKNNLEIEELCHVVDFYIAPESKQISGQVTHLGLVC